MTDVHHDDPSRLVISGLVDITEQYDLKRLHDLGERCGDSNEVVVPLRRVMEDARPTASSSHVTAVSADGTYSASIPLEEALSKGELHVSDAPGEAATIRLEVPGGLTLCWNVKGLGGLRVTAGPEPDSLPDILTH